MENQHKDWIFTNKHKEIMNEKVINYQENDEINKKIEFLLIKKSQN
jgi:hypothetical protein